MVWEEGNCGDKHYLALCAGNSSLSGAFAEKHK